jgi:hypothetical protein
VIAGSLHLPATLYSGLALAFALVSMVACRSRFEVCSKTDECNPGQTCVRGTCTVISDYGGDASPSLEVGAFFGPGDGDLRGPVVTTPERPEVDRTDAREIEAGLASGPEVDRPDAPEVDANLASRPEVDRPDAPDIDAGLTNTACGEEGKPLGLVAATKLRAGKATGIALDGNQLFMSAHGLSLASIPGAMHPCPEVATAGVDSSGIIEQFDITERFDPISKGATCLADLSAQEVWALAADRGDLFAAGDYVGIVGYRVGSDGLRGSKPIASHLPPLPVPESYQGTLPPDTCGWIPGWGTRAPSAVALSVAWPPGWTKRIGLVGYLYCNLFGIYDLSATNSRTIPVLAYYRSVPPAPGYVNSTIAAVWGEKPDRFYALSTVYALDGTWTFQFEVVQMESPSAEPKRLGEVSISRPQAGGAGSLAASGNYVYWAASEAQPYSGGLRVFDVSDARNPVLVGRLDIPHVGVMPWKGASLAVSGSTVYFAGAEGLHLIDVSDPRHPSNSGQPLYRWPETFGTCHGGYPTLLGDYAYVAVNCFPEQAGVEGEGTGGLAIYRVRSSRSMTCDGQCVNVEESRRHCGGCHQACNPYQSCVLGVCVSG